ncbi:MAG: preprotein translocase subunit Sec61beta [DPANN group archaeon]|nr:preprotein translocase subunit Sec61beta [DPANN group archaeon]
MAKKKQVNLPSSTAGLVRYFDDYKETIQIKPEHVIIGISIVIVLEILMKKMLII